MTAQIDPQVDEVLRQMRRFASALQEQQRRTDTESFTATDEAKTVEVTLNGKHWLTGVFIQDGLMRLGPKTVAQRLNEALRNAEAAATSAVTAEQERLVASLVDIVGEVQKGQGLS